MSTNGFDPRLSFINKRILSFNFLGREYKCTNWYDMFIKLAQEMHERHKDSFQKCLTLKGRKMKYISTNSSDLEDPKAVPDTCYYITSKLNSDAFYRRCCDLIRLFGYREEDLRVTAI